MRHFVVLVVGALLIGTTAGDQPESEKAPPEDVCDVYGNNFCTVAATCNASTNVNGTFTCKCEQDNMYFDATEKFCKYKKTCATTECSVGFCKEYGNQAKCVCENMDFLKFSCKVRDFFIKECEKKGATAVVDTTRMGGARCSCGEWEVMNSKRTQCVSTTCLHPGVTCKDLCEKKLLHKDPRCCEGWDQTDCSKPPRNGTYCSPGWIRKDQDCESVCATGEAKLICKNGCKRSSVPGRAYECICNSGYVVAEDGIHCKADYKRRPCTEEEEDKCFPGQYCVVRNNTAVCECPTHEHLLDGKCTGECSENKCHENFTDCGVYFGKQGCFCPWRGRKNPKTPLTRECTFNEYYYMVSFKPIISLDAQNCVAHEKRVLQAIQTTIGPEVHKLEILNCTDNIKARLITDSRLSPYLLKKLQTCEYTEGDVCIIYPMLRIQKGSATEIEEENICDSLLKQQADATKDTNECVKDGDHFWFKCKRGFREVDRKTKGRLWRSVCEPGVSCDEDAEQRCQKQGRICVLQESQMVCQCPLGYIEDQGNCKATCTQEKRKECEDNGEECVVDNNEAVCRNKGASTATTEAVPVPDPETCTKERKEQCGKNNEECVVENGRAICKPKSDVTLTTEAPHGSGSGTVAASAALLLAILIPAVYHI